MSVNKIKNTLLDYFFPSYCFNCKNPVDKGKVICDECYEEIGFTNKNACFKCGLSEKECQCKFSVFHFSFLSAPFVNEEIAKKGIYSLKFFGNKILTDFYAEHMVKSFAERTEERDFSLVTYVPMSFPGYFKRGYNQAFLLAEKVAAMLSLPVEATLKRSIFSFTQHKRCSVDERFENAYRSYKYIKNVKGRVLLIDDIKTTGASLEACARELLKAGADEVYCLTALVGNKN